MRMSKNERAWIQVGVGLRASVLSKSTSELVFRKWAQSELRACLSKERRKLSLVPSTSILRVTSDPSQEVGDTSVDAGISFLSTLVSEGDDAELVPASILFVHKWTSRITLAGILPSFRFSSTDEVMVDSIRIRECTSFDTRVVLVTFLVTNHSHIYFHQVVGNRSLERSGSPSYQSNWFTDIIILVHFFRRHADRPHFWVGKVDVLAQFEQSYVVVTSPNTVVLMWHNCCHIVPITLNFDIVATESDEEIFCFHFSLVSNNAMSSADDVSSVENRSATNELLLRRITAWTLKHCCCPRPRVRTSIHSTDDWLYLWSDSTTWNWVLVNTFRMKGSRREGERGKRKSKREGRGKRKRREREEKEQKRNLPRMTGGKTPGRSVSGQQTNSTSKNPIGTV